RGLGGAAGIRIAATGAERSGHRLSFRLRLGLGEESLPRPRLDGVTLLLPERLDVLPEAAQNRALYLWLAAFFAHLPPDAYSDPDPLRRDLLFLRRAHRTTQAVLAAAPGLNGTHHMLCQVLRSLRPQRRLPPAEADVEQAVLALLDAPADAGRYGACILADADPRDFSAPRHYHPFLPVPLWGDAITPAASPPDEAAEQGDAGRAGEGNDRRVRKAQRRPGDQVERSDSLILNRFEKILSVIESMNINRAVEDDDEEDARKALDDAEEIGLSTISRKAATRLKVELDLPPPAVDAAPLQAEHTYPEWDYKARAYHKDHCRVITGPAAETGERWAPDDALSRRIRHVRRQFEAFRPGLQILRGQPDGAELDLDALVRARADLVASGVGSDRIHQSIRRQARDLSVALLVDTSLSTDSWTGNRRVLDVEKDALLVFANALATCGDDHAIFTFTSRRRQFVKVDTVKSFDEAFGPSICRRIAALKPGHYTRMGAALRHATAQLALRSNRHRLLLVITDGKPNDSDHYEGRYGAEDTRRAIQEARQAGMTVFGVTIDATAQAYFPMLFGRGGYAIVPEAGRLPAVLPALYRQLSTG
ncbi:MAG TPA: VWA domain-containing protein, partial [Rhodopila sp.]|nr:VWA domain-containing protein [Rhodopila sp.]